MRCHCKLDSGDALFTSCLTVEIQRSLMSYCVAWKEGFLSYLKINLPAGLLTSSFRSWLSCHLFEGLSIWSAAWWYEEGIFRKQKLKSRIWLLFWGWGIANTWQSFEVLLELRFLGLNTDWILMKKVHFEEGRKSSLIYARDFACESEYQKILECCDCIIVRCLP
jgi:hypothetical protein